MIRLCRTNLVNHGDVAIGTLELVDGVLQKLGRVLENGYRQLLDHQLEQRWAELFDVLVLRRLAQ